MVNARNTVHLHRLFQLLTTQIQNISTNVNKIKITDFLSYLFTCMVLSNQRFPEQYSLPPPWII